MKVSEAMHHGVEWCDPDTPIPEIARLFRDKDIGAVPIGDDDRLVGMVTDRDIVCGGVAEGLDVTRLTAADVMTGEIHYCWEDDGVEDAANLMERYRVRRMPVINNAKRMVGIVSLGDLTHAMPQDMSGELVQAVSAHH